MTTEELLKKNRNYIERLNSLSSGELATLRRANRDFMSDARIFSILAKLGVLDREMDSFIAVLYAGCHRSGDKSHVDLTFNFGQAFRLALANGNGDFKAEKHDGRFKAVIASSKEELYYRLRQAVRLINSREGRIDFALLLRDLKSWECESRWVQRIWTRGFYQIVEEKKGDNDVN